MSNTAKSEASATTPVKKRRRRSKKKKNYYFGPPQEEAIAAYIHSDDHETRTQLYVDTIRPAFDELVNKIVFTYKFTSVPNIEILREECKVWLTTVIDKFNPDKGSKAFSYFSVITKNWFIHKAKQHTTQARREIQLEDMSKTIEETYLSEENVYDTARDTWEFWQHLNKEIESWSKLSMKPNEEKVYEAIKILLSKPEDIEIFNKKAIYLYLRELTGLSTKQVVTCLNKMRERYKVFKTDWISGEVR